MHHADSGLYYLQSRYYDPKLGRFLNADALVSTKQSVLGCNQFSYCLNNPVIYRDPHGMAPIFAPFHVYNGEYSADYEIVDLTEKLTSFMRFNADKLQEYYYTNGFAATALYFYQNVTDGGSLDIKLQEEWKFDSGKVYLFNGNRLRMDDPGNINFGYVGAVIFPLDILCLGAGLNQIKNWGFEFGDFSTFFDDPRDNQMIKYGYALYWGDK